MNRRSFMVTTMSTGIMAGVELSESAFAAPRDVDVSGLNKGNIPTPSLVLDLDAFEYNIKTMADHCRKAKCAFRPHAKTHKCPEIARRQVAAGALGNCVATVPEAEALAAGGVRGLLLTSPIVDVGKISRVVAIAARGGEIMLSIGHIREAELLSQAAEAARLNFSVLVDLDIGSKRTGIMPGQPAVELAQKISRLPRLHVKGIQAYAGHSAHVVGWEARQKSSRESMALAIETSKLFRSAGIDAQILSGGSTGTYNIDSEIAAEIAGMELQVGSFVFMDVDYRRIGGKDGNATYSDFRPSLTVLTTVVSTTHADRVSIDAGTKSLDTTTRSSPEAKDRPGLQYSAGGDEFGVLASRQGTNLPQLGERLEFIVPHCDPSVNLYEQIYAWVEAIWPIAARREFAPASA
jgi:D-serine deaminase-like pyridoxal phosphate-dependent protein